MAWVGPEPWCLSGNCRWLREGPGSSRPPPPVSDVGRIFQAQTPRSHLLRASRPSTQDSAETFLIVCQSRGFYRHPV